MSYTNLTLIRVGMVGTLAGKQYRAVGRVVMGMNDAGETYYWNEFNLVSDDGDSVTLVYEVTESGGEWRLFTLFAPENPMSAEEAASKSVGDPVNLDGQPMRVTLVDESKVYFIEGQAPEGVEVGDVAHYFNCEAGNRMVVVSWTGDEVECYRGLDLSRGTVASAFSLGIEPGRDAVTPSISSSFLGGEAVGSPPSGIPLKMVVALLAFAILIGGYAIWRQKHSQSVVTKTHAPAAPLVVGSAGTLEGKHYRIRGHALVEIAEVGRLYDRHEYLLSGDDESRTLLVYDSKPRAKDWVLFTPLEPVTPLTPQQAAALHTGDTVNLDGLVASVGEIFQSAIRESDSPELPDLNTGAVSFAFSGQSGSTLLLARWNERGISFHRGKILPAKDVIAAFK
ncbi:MAG: DUF4178 domain-containing protein [Verrucomicrobia bacterium]|nr:DUF4178 domain-containing protein [Verrucomicrobiota bacterium]